MRITIDATGLGESKTGTSVYLVEILSVWNRDASINHEFVVFTSPRALQHLTALNLDGRFRFISAPDNRYIRSLWQQTVMGWHIHRLRADVHWGVAFVLPLLSAKPMVVTIHDLTFQLFPAVHERIKRYYFPAMIKAAIRKAVCVLAVSETTRNDLYRLIPISRGKTVVTLLAARHLALGMRRGETLIQSDIDNGYLLFVGTVEPRKNLERLIAAWQSIDPIDRRNTRLIIVGAKGWLVDNLLSQAATESAIEFKGFVEDDELAHLISEAKVFAYPSLYEGFGLPVLEAMAQGIPVLTSNIGATREVAATAALLVDPTSISSIRDGLVQLLNDEALRRELSRRGKARAEIFSWEQTAKATLACIESSTAVIVHK
jgi:glycosyltransferase involved in cell wall biosynthesis